jgi:spore coat protein A, manganese oxidase
VKDGVMAYHDPVTENPQLNSTEIWEIYNETEDAHPIHLHLVRMQLVNRQKFSAHIDIDDGEAEDIRLVGQPKTAAPDEQGWKDTWVTYPGEVTRVIATFDLPGMYVWHCHILSHEDHEMMRPYVVGNMDAMTRNAVAEKAAAVEKAVALKVVPNPFSNQFTVRFKLAKPSTVAVNLYDSKGSLVKNIHSGQLPVGEQQVSVDGSSHANGMYYCEVIVNGERLLRKMLLQK